MVVDGSKELSLELLLWLASEGFDGPVPMLAKAAGSTPALSPKAGERAYTGAEGAVIGGAGPRGLRQTGGTVGGTGTLETGGAGTGGFFLPLTAWLHGVRRLDGGGGGVAGTAGSGCGGMGIGGTVGTGPPLAIHQIKESTAVASASRCG